MLAAVRTGLRTIEMRDLDEPGEADDTAIIRTLVTGICGSDLHPYHGRAAPQRVQEGHEVAGEIVHLPDSSTGPLRVGDRVAVDIVCAGVSCGTCAACRDGQFFHCRTRSVPEWGGSFASAFERRPQGLFRIPDTLTDEQGALIEPLAVAVHGVRWGRMRPGSSVAVIGAGSIGLVTLLAAKGLGAAEVHVVARHPHQAALAMALGATSTSTPEEARRAILDRTGGRGVDIAFETVGGHATTVDLAWDVTRIQGTAVVLGIFPDPVPVNLIRPVVRELWATFPICYGVIDGRHDFDVAIDLIASGHAPVERLVTHRFSLADAPEAFRVAADKSTGSVKVHLRP